MTRQQLLSRVRAHRGPICAPISGNNDVHWVRVVKSDLLLMLDGIEDGELEARVTAKTLYIDRAN